MGITWEKEGNTGDLWLKSFRGMQFVVSMFLGGIIVTRGIAVTVFISVQ